MKRSSLHFRSKPMGFTLIELLVVMAIIAILAGVLFGASSMAINAAKRAKAANFANQLQTGVSNYYTEYSVYPAPSGQAAGTDFLISDANGSAATWGGMIYALCGNICPYNSSTTAPGNAASNTRAVAFLNLKKSDVDVNNAPLNPLPPSTANPYFNLAIDYDYDNIVGDSGGVGASMPNFATSTTTAMTYIGAQGVTGGIAIWANCNGTTTTTSPNSFVHTY
jgi:prepilin-type N-terminal cleavage/methylation domain-containing protein